MTDYDDFIKEIIGILSTALDIPISEITKDYEIEQSYSRECMLRENIRKNYAVIQEEIYKDFLLQEALHDHI